MKWPVRRSRTVNRLFLILSFSTYGPQSAPSLAAGVNLPREGGQADRPGNFNKLVLEFDILNSLAR